MTARRMSTARRARIFTAANGICHICGERIDGTKDRWEAEHVIPLEISRDDSDENLRPAHAKCHRVKTSTQDAPAIAKCKRVERKHNGFHRSANPLPGGRGSKFKKKVNGEVVRRD